MYSFLLSIFTFSLLSLCNSAEKRSDFPLPSDPFALPFDFSTHPECNVRSRVAQMPAPKLAKKITMKGEAKVKLDTDYAKAFLLFHLEEYFDSDKQQGADVVYMEGKKSTVLYNFKSGKAYMTRERPDEIDDRTCKSLDLLDDEYSCSPYTVFVNELAGHSDVLKKCQYSSGNLTYLGEQGNATVRNISVRKWTQCVYDHKTETLSVNNFYFNEDGMDTPSGTADILIRFESKVLSGHITNHTFTLDITFYAPEVVDDSVFMPASGSFCSNWTNGEKIMPSLPDQFSLTMLSVLRHEGEIHTISLNLDYKKQLASFISDSLKGTHFPSTTTRNGTLFRTVHDYNSGLAFVQPIDVKPTGIKKCIVSVVDGTTLNGQTTVSTVHLRHSFEIFEMAGPGWVYIGTRNFTSMPCHVWSNQRNASDIFLTEVYWLHENWTTNKVPMFIGMMLYRKDLSETTIESYHTIVSDYNNMYPFPRGTFNTDGCLRTGSNLQITLTIQVQNCSEVTSHISSFQTGMRDTLSRLLNTSSLRFTDFQVTEETVSNQLTVSLTILEWLNGTKRPDSKAMKLSATVAKDLEHRLSTKDLDVTVTFAGKNQTITILKNSLKSGSNLVSRTNSDTTDTLAETPQLVQVGYTAGAMAGLAIAMIIIAGVAGLLIGFLVGKRKAVAYKVHDWSANEVDNY